jgi:hypothetical protein
MEINAMCWWSDKESRERWDTAFKGVQAIGIFVGAIWIAWTYFDTRTRELRKPYDEKQLNFYTDAARVAAHLAIVEEAKLKTDPNYLQFWELYWGELPFVESAEVRARMQVFCHIRFESSNDLLLCGTSSDKIKGRVAALKNNLNDQDRKSGTAPLNAAIAISEKTKCEVKERWEAKTTLEKFLDKLRFWKKTPEGDADCADF